MKTYKVWINGRFFDIDHAKILVSDRGFLYGDGVFETMRAYAGVIFRLDDHLARLKNSLKAVMIKVPYTHHDLRTIIYRCLKVNGLASAYVRLTVTRGEGRFGLDYKDTFRPNIVIVTKEFGHYPDAMYDRGIRAVCITNTRQNEHSPLSKIKSLNFLNYIIARFSATKSGFDEAILLNTKGDVAEGTVSNIFLVKKGAMVTPSIDSGILPGITRGVIIELAKSMRCKVYERYVRKSELSAADEAFLTNSLVEVLPVTVIGRKKIGKGRPGDLTKLLRISYQKQVIRETLHIR